MGWLQKLRARRSLKSRVGLWYHRDYANLGVEMLPKAARHVADRARLALADLEERKWVRMSDVRVPFIVSTEALARVHSTDYLQETDTPVRLAAILGVEPGDFQTEAVIRAQRLAVGGTIAAARAARHRRVQFAFNLGGGFHHAAPESGAGFCVYNDIAVAISELRSDGFRKPIMIVDLDYHQGDGNLTMFENDDTVLVFSIHGSVWSHLDPSQDINILLPEGTDDEAYLARVADSVPKLLRDVSPGLVFYIAGADVLAGDALGDFALTPAGVLRRDRLVLETCEELSIPVAITLAGGYSANAWHTTANMIRWALTGATEVTSSSPESLRVRFDRISAKLQSVDLQAETDAFELTEEDVYGDLMGQKPRRRILDYYTAHGVEYALEAYNILPQVRKRGFADLRLDVDPTDASHQTVRLFGTKQGDEHLLFELVLRRLTREGYEFASIEWMRMQDPTAKFSLERPPLPGQDHPGLGMTNMVLELLVQMCKRMKLDGLINHPSHFHIAFGLRGWQFLEPRLEGEFQALCQLLSEVDILEATRAFGEGRITRAGVAFPWEPADRVLGLSERLVSYLEEPSRLEAIRQAREAGQFGYDR